MFPWFLLLILGEMALQHLADSPDYRVYSAATVTDADQMMEMNQRNVDIRCRGIQDAGFLSVRDGKTLGHFGLVQAERSAYLVLLKDETWQKIRRGENTALLHCRLIQDDKAEKEVEELYAGAMNLSKESMDQFLSPVILDETSYPGEKILALQILKPGILLILILSILYLVLALFFPSCQESARVLDRLNRSGKHHRLRKRAARIRILDRELEKKLLFMESGLLITEHYVILPGAMHLRVCRLADLQNGETKKIVSRGRKKEKYRVTAGNGHISFRYDFPDEQTASFVCALMSKDKKE